MNTNNITGDRLVSKTSDAYRNNWDNIFKKKEPEPEPKREVLIRNSGYCAICKEEIVSKHRHDFVQCKCKGSFVDGGLVYARAGGSLVDTALYADEDDYNTIREYLSWRSYGINGDEPAKDILLKDLTTLHIQNILKTQLHIKGSYVEKALQYELELRKEHA